MEAFRNPAHLRERMAALFRLRAEQSESVAAWIRLVALAVIAPALFALMIERGSGPLIQDWLQLSMVALGVVYSIVVLLLLRRDIYADWMPYFSVAADCIGLNLTLGLSAWLASPLYLHSSAALLLYGVFIAGVGARLSGPLTLAAGVVCTVLYTAMWIGLYPQIRAMPGAAALPGIQIGAFALRSIYILATSIVVYLTVRFVNTLALETIEATSEKERLQAERSMLSRFLQPELVENLIRGDLRMVSEGRRVELCIGFVDIRGFTALCERLSPEQLQPFMNRYFSAITEEILIRGGTLDKYIGDGVMFFFGAPLSQADDADRAMETAIGIDRTLVEFNQENRMIGLPVVQYGVGVHSDVVIVGAFGSPERIDYTAFGDGVNVAARIEKASRDASKRILISDRMRRRLRKDYGLRSIGFVTLAGKTDSIELFEPALPPAEEAI